MIHPTIKEFWEKKNKVGVIVDDYSATQIVNGQVLILARKYPDGWFYYFYSIRTEREMIKIIKLKAFI